MTQEKVQYSWGSCPAYMHSKVKDWWAWRDEKWVERPGERRGGCLIEIYHYTVICVNYCAAIEQQQHEFGSRPCTHTHKRTRCASSGAVIEGVSVLVATVQVLSAGLVCVRSMTAGRPLIHTNTHTHINTHKAVTHSLRSGVTHKHGCLSNAHRHLALYFCVYMYQKHFLCLLHIHTYTHTAAHIPILSCDCGEGPAVKHRWSIDTRAVH